MRPAGGLVSSKRCKMLELSYKFMARNQYGNTIMIKAHPRAELCEHHGVKHADKMYMDTSEGVKHIGYVVSQNWYNVYGLEGNIFTK